MDVIWTITFKIIAEIEVRKHLFCVLLRRRVISALLGICSFTAMKCFYVVFFFTTNSPVIFLKYTFDFVLNTA